MSTSEPPLTKAQVAAALAALQGLTGVEPTSDGDQRDMNVKGDHRSLDDGAVTYREVAPPFPGKVQERGKGK